jgi:hypothetical protein
MKAASPWCKVSTCVVAAFFFALFEPGTARAVTTVFFDSSQATNLVESGVTSDTISSEGYLFTFTRDKLFTGGVGLTNPIGRMLRVPWPNGLEAQAVTAGPTPGGARISIKRQDGEQFDIRAFTARLLANTGGAGAAFEIMPMLAGEDGRPDPYMYNATGYAGMQFSYVTPELTAFDEYKLTLYVDFALMSLTIVDDSAPPPELQIVFGATAVGLSWPSDAAGYTLESSPVLPAQLWSQVTNHVTVIGNLSMVTIPNTNSQQYFRLKK